MSEFGFSAYLENLTLRKEEERSYCLIQFSFGKMRRVLEMDGGDGYAAM